MTWTNGRLTERKQGDSIGTVSVDWEVGAEVVFTFSKTFDTSVQAEKEKFKTEANKDKNDYLARVSKQDTVGQAITTFMNS